jgi:hypothetical protein
VELGTEQGFPRFQWRFSENLFLPMRHRDGGYDYIANRESGLIEAHPRMEYKKVAPYLSRQWVICRWLAPGPESQWRSLFGAWVEYPRNGYYAPTNIALDPDINPWDCTQDGMTVTQGVIGVAREQLEKTYREHYEDGVRAVEAREKASDKVLEDKIGALILPFLSQNHMPGEKDSVSLPTPASRDKWEATFGAAGASEKGEGL